MRRLALALQYGATLAVVLGLSKVHATLNEYDFTNSSRFAWSLAYVAMLAIAAYGVGLPEERRGRGRVTTALAATLAAALLMSLTQLVAGSALLPRFVVFGSALVLTVVYTLVGYLAASASDRAEARDRVVLVGSRGDAELLLDDLRLAPERPAQLVEAVEPPDVHAGRPGAEPLVDLVIDQDASVLVLALEAQDDEQIVRQASILHESGVRVRTLTAFYEEWLGKLPISELERISLMFDIREVHEEGYGRVKRMLDLVLGLVGSAGFVLSVPLVWVGDLVANRGPLFYRQQRVGRHGRPFSILKYRTMRPADGALPDEWTSEEDPRITPWGRVLRRTHLDELPQMLNVLRGDLALVGPRPEQPQYVSELEQKLPFYDLRHLVRPGLTGWAQVKYGYAGNERDALEKLQYEFFYLGHQSLGFDLRILGRTIRSVLGSEGR